LKNTLAYYNAGAIAVYSEVVGLANFKENGQLNYFNKSGRLQAQNFHATLFLK
jgi:hypothetical protein